MMDTSERWRINQVLSINAAVRQLKKEENGLYNCICSILTDADFVAEASASCQHPLSCSTPLRPPPRRVAVLRPSPVLIA